MSEIFIQDGTACHLEYTDAATGNCWHIVVGFVNISGFATYYSALLETEDGYRQIGQPIDGPWFNEAEMAAAFQAAPGTGGNPIGRYLIWKMPVVQQRLDEHFDPTPAPPIDWNTAPITIKNANIALSQFFKMVPDQTGTNAPRFERDL